MNKDLLCELGYEDSVVFSDPEYDDAIIGVSTDGNVIYDYDLMVQSLAEKDGITLEEAADFVEYNTIRSLGYAPYPKPIISYKIFE